MTSDIYPVALKIIGFCWTIFAVIWLLAAFATKQSIYKERTAQRLRYVIPILLGWLLLAKGHRLSDPLNYRVIPHVDALAWIGTILCIAGLIFCVWARFTLGRNWSGVVTLKGGHELITSGPYAIVRHPIYTGILVMIIGTVLVDWAVAYGSLGANFAMGGGEALANTSRAIGALVLVKTGMIGLPLVFVSFWLKLGYEEKLMLEKFPDEYASYQRRVRRLIPFVL